MGDEQGNARFEAQALVGSSVEVYVGDNRKFNGYVVLFMVDGVIYGYPLDGTKIVRDEGLVVVPLEAIPEAYMEDWMWQEVEVLAHSGRRE